MGERETLRPGSAAWAGTVALALGAAATQGSPASASTVITGEDGVDVTVTTVGVDLINYSESSPYVVYFQGSPVFDVYYRGLDDFGDQAYVIVGVNSGDLVNIGETAPTGTAIVTKLPAGVTIDAATFTNPQNAGTMKNPNSAGSPFYVPLEVTTDGGKDWYYGWAGVSDADLTLDSYAFANTATSAPVPEPSTWTLLALGAAGVLAIRRRSRSLGQALAQ
jgi:hypothetical protein